MKQIQIFIDTLSATCRLSVHEIMKIDCESLATYNQTRYNEEKRRRRYRWQEIANVFARVEPEVKEQARAGA